MHIAALQQQVANEKAGKRKLFQTIVKLAAELEQRKNANASRNWCLLDLTAALALATCGNSIDGGVYGLMVLSFYSCGKQISNLWLSLVYAIALVCVLPLQGEVESKMVLYAVAAGLAVLQAIYQVMLFTHLPPDASNAPPHRFLAAWNVAEALLWGASIYFGSYRLPLVLGTTLWTTLKIPAMWGRQLPVQARMYEIHFAVVSHTFTTDPLYMMLMVLLLMRLVPLLDLSSLQALVPVASAMASLVVLVALYAFDDASLDGNNRSSSIVVLWYLATLGLMACTVGVGHALVTVLEGETGDMPTRAYQGILTALLILSTLRLRPAPTEMGPPRARFFLVVYLVLVLRVGIVVGLSWITSWSLPTLLLATVSTLALRHAEVAYLQPRDGTTWMCFLACSKPAVPPTNLSFVQDERQPLNVSSPTAYDAVVV